VNKFKCPYCGEQSVSALRKLILSPVVSHNCSKCQAPICVPFKSTLLALPSLLIIIFGSNFFSVNVVVVLFALSMTLTSYLHLKFVPLIKAKL
jgi:hypothetical protein